MNNRLLEYEEIIDLLNTYHQEHVIQRLNQLDEKSREKLYKNAVAMSRKGLTKMLKLLSLHFFLYNSKLKDYFKNFQKPRLVIMGSKDYIFLPKVKKYEKENSFTKVLVIKNGTHLCNIQKDILFNEKVLEFLGK